MTAKIGIQIHPVYTQANGQTRAYSAQEKTDLDTFLLQLQPSSIIVLNDFSWAQRFVNMLPNTKVIFRKEHPHDGAFWNLKHEDGRPYTPMDHFIGTKEHHDPRIMLNLSNEGLGKTTFHDDGKPDYDTIAKMTNWLVECMRLFGEAGIPLVTPNWGVGLPDIKWFKADSLEWSLIRPLFQAFAKWPIHELGIHTYWRKDGFVSDDYLNRPRDLALALTKLNMPVPNMQVTEYGVDAIDGHPGPWMEAYGNTEEGQKEYGRLLIKGQRENLNLPFIRGIHVFPWACYPRWTKYDISKAKIIHAMMISSNLSLPDTPAFPTPPPQPEPSWATGVAVTVSTGAVIRFQADVNSKALATVYSSETIGYDRNYNVEGWYRIRKGNVTGYASKQFLTEIILGELPAPNPNPTPTPIPPAPTQSEIDLRKVASNTEAIATKQAEIMALEAEISVILAKWLPNAA